MKMSIKISRTAKAAVAVFAVIILLVTASTWWPYIANWERLGWMKPQISRAVTDAKVQTLNLTTCAILLENMTNGDVVSRWIDVPSMSWPNGYIEQSKSYKVVANADTLKIIADNLGMPVLLAKTFTNKLVFVEGIWAMPSGQVYLIVQIADLYGIKKPGYYGIPEFAIRFFATKPIAEQALSEMADASLQQASLRAGFSPSRKTQRFEIPSNRVWTELVGLNIPDSSLVTIQMSGQFRNGRYSNMIGPNGVGGCGFDSGSGPISNSNPCGTFFQIGSSKPIFIGSRAEVRVFQGGSNARIGVNDDFVTDNTGKFIANVTITTLVAS